MWYGLERCDCSDDLKRERDREGEMIDRSLPGALLLSPEDAGKHTGGGPWENQGGELLPRLHPDPRSAVCDVL